ncbi:MAG: DNA polymerase III subunit delta, partial [Minwuiales bacterium]|nr:DNA polymerase III subunit delta [Minwuiales bacterium]
MKLQERQVQGFLNKPDPKVRAVLVYGPDGGLVRERALLLCKTVVADLSDPFRVAVLTGPVLDKDPARLADELGAIALTGGRRVVRLRDIGNKHSKLIESVLAENTGDALLVAEADSLGPRDSLRALFEKASNAAALPCYADAGDSLERLVETSLSEAKLTAEPDAMAYLMENLGSDRMITRRELEKLVLFKGDDGGSVTLDDARACVGDSSAMALDDVAFACAGGDLAKLEHSLSRCFMAGEASVQVLRRVAQHFQKLHLAATQRDRGEPVET